MQRTAGMCIMSGMQQLALCGRYCKMHPSSSSTPSQQHANSRMACMASIANTNLHVFEGAAEQQCSWSRHHPELYTSDRCICSHAESLAPRAACSSELCRQLSSVLATTIMYRLQSEGCVTFCSVCGLQVAVQLVRDSSRGT